ncbi:MAG: Txe/YoeB family addiction module toxin [Prevotellaceae bacterium]|jgi:toxin YoeB|nr:Txe/YoeB family addiction module toxin [Prevotellaceae bacterium]
MYRLDYTERARNNIVQLKKNEPAAYQKLVTLLEELAEHPRTGTGKPKQLSGNMAGEWSRRISRTHRLRYLIDDDIVTVTVIQAYGHYDDK